MPHFLIIARDGADSDALKRRMAAREVHISDFKSGLASGQNLIGGALLNDQEEMCGSMLVVDFPSRAVLDEWIAQDAYVTGNVWQDIEIIPFKLAGIAGA